MTVIKTALRDIHKIYTDLLSSMQAIKYNKENHFIQNKINNISTELHNHGKQITLFQFPAHMGIKGMRRHIK